MCSGGVAPEGSFDLTFQDGEGLFKVVAVRGRTAAGRNMHVYEAITTVSVVAREQDGVGISHKSDVGQALVSVGACNL